MKAAETMQKGARDSYELSNEMPSCSSQVQFYSVANKSLIKLLPKLPPNSAEILTLDCSSNQFKNIDSLGKLENCDEVIASYNKLVNFASFSPLQHTLRILDVSHNEISDASHVFALQNLTWLDASHNFITGLPALSKLESLVYLNLAANKIASLASLRGFSKLHRLETLILNGNKLTSLRNAVKYLPENLKTLDLGVNLISELTEALSLSHLEELSSLTWRGNPCVPHDRRFDYRSFLLFCCPHSLKNVDGKELSELEVLKGELLLTKGKIRNSTTHRFLCSYLADECPLDVASPQCHASAHFEKQMKKVIARRREYLNSINDPNYRSPDLSLALPQSPYTEWLQRDPNATSLSESFSDQIVLAQKENRPPNSSSDDSSPESVTSAISSTTVIISATQDTSNTAIPDIKREMKRTVSNACKSASSQTISKPSINSSDRRQMGRRPVRNEASAAAVPSVQSKMFVWETGQPQSLANYYQAGRNFGLRSTSPVIKTAPLPTISDEKTLAASKIQTWWRIRKAREGAQRVHDLEKRLKKYEGKFESIEKVVTNLSEHNEQLSVANEELTQIIDALQSKIATFESDSNMMQNWKKMINFAIPVPVDLKYERRSPTEILLRWQHYSLIQPTGHGFTVNGDFIGKSRSTGNQTVISDLVPDKETTIRINCYVDDIEGNKSLPLYIPPCSKDDESTEDAGSPNDSVKTC